MNRMAEIDGSEFRLLMRADLITVGIDPNRYLGKRKPSKYVHLSPNWKAWTCMICHKNYKYYGALISHIKKHHPEDIERL